MAPAERSVDDDRQGPRASDCSRSSIPDDTPAAVRDGASHAAERGTSIVVVASGRLDLDPAVLERLERLRTGDDTDLLPASHTRTRDHRCRRVRRLFSLLATKANPDGVAHAFEPHPAIFARLQKNVACNEAAVTCVQKAVGATAGSARFFHVPGGLPSSSSLSESFMRSGDAEIVATEVPVITLDEYVREREIDRVDLIKIDTETTEPDVLAGMQTVLERDRPTIFCEVLAGQGVERRIDDLLRPLDYQFHRLEKGGPVGGTSIEDLQARLGRTSANYVFAAREADLALLAMTTIAQAQGI